MNNNFDISTLGQRVNIRTLASGAIPSSLRGVKLLSILDPASARQMDDVVARHAAIAPYLTGWRPERWTDQNYVKLEHSNGQVEYYGTSWLDFESVEVVTDETLKIELGSVSDEDIGRIRRILIKAGFDDIRSMSRQES